ncbi:hypothetical protein [Mumia zhuanghuii]|uniref:Uncharacterized protein n=1 Tax=Mumia zhuanghuii TaxID=2585211 RepID=A0A5C4MD78_9ACTN|nr:hypothetical protein [Mumia zhuanghuii]TNC34389.1 hypothetical protein FHE65_27850 [Mumia zhuanghuii]TNC38340.1 hypothetical protein FHE65_24435 [Mumia zhuanghuii]
MGDDTDHTSGAPARRAGMGRLRTSRSASRSVRRLPLDRAVGKASRTFVRTVKKRFLGTG